MYNSDHDVDENLDDGSVKQLYERGWLHDAENREEYQPWGFHPVHIGDRFGTAGQFRIIHKLGRGGTATVWLCRDQDTQEYVALKIIIVDESRENSSELRLLNQEGLDFDVKTAIFECKRKTATMMRGRHVSKRSNSYQPFRGRTNIPKRGGRGTKHSSILALNHSI